ncbi:hypothetical protein [Candidatus Rhabdochlamydia porcellionis]|jgi:hypothetical protein|uniref:Uncharacterized protein n=1 Tax=Candidatus Rhabdochlamydia porcellionis TaxID=225148 RepID=A0ABX8YY60_9BACT|nr:hypothetical protein [Candidatus Rhabdochlamydia porcellionis]QZA58224.1 hypothetical protein RHAB15C_0000094 [Candidatus Rhabdochlamydia porcellionis]
MTWPSDLARQSTNPFSPQNMITKNLMDQALKNNRNTRLLTSSSSSSSDDENTTYYQAYNYQAYKATSARSSLLEKHIKPETSTRDSSSLRHVFSCCCIQ